MKKKILIGLASFIGLLVLLMVLIPVFFKEDIKAMVDEQIAANVNAEVRFEAEDFYLSFFENFPNVTAGINNVAVINRAPFEGHPLASLGGASVEINLVSLLFGEQMEIEGIYIHQPSISVQINEAGQANYDIAMPSDSTNVATSSEEESSDNLNLGINHWEITEGTIVYDDRQAAMLAKIDGLNHTGSGDFSLTEMDLETSTTIKNVFFAMEGSTYLSDKRVGLDMVIGISEDFTKYTFKENKFNINDFELALDGFLKLLEEGIETDLTFASNENSFKSLLSLIPAFYTHDYNALEASGALSFDGNSKGKYLYDGSKIPGFKLGLKVKDGAFHYPDLPSAVKNVQIDLQTSNTDGNLYNTQVNLNQFHLELGSNPIDATMHLKKLYPALVDADVKAAINLNEVSQVFPIDGVELKGMFSVDVAMDGTYDTLGSMPNTNAWIELKNGFVKSSDFPIPLESIHLISKITNQKGNLQDTHIEVSKFHMIMDEKPFDAELILEDLENYKWNLNVTGGLDIGKITKIFPSPGITMEGLLDADIHSKGNYQHVTNEQYDLLSTSGSLQLKNFLYQDSTLAYDVVIKRTDLAFTPQNIQLKSFDGSVGESDMLITGSISNYIAYIFKDNQLLKGTIDLNSNYLNLNEFMVEEETSASTAIEAETIDSETIEGVIPVPNNILFTATTQIKKVDVMDYTMTNAHGSLVVKDGIADLSHMQFDMLGGNFIVDGTYNTKDIQDPKYTFNMKMDKVSILETFNTFELVKKYAPIAANIVGEVSSDFKVSGNLDQNMMPDLKTVNATGLLEIAKAALNNSKLVSGITSFTKSGAGSSTDIKDIVMSATIENGQLKVDPFDLVIGNYKTNVTGSSGLDGNLNYDLKMEIPTSELGASFNSFVSQHSEEETIRLPIKVQGTYDQLKITVDDSIIKNQIKDAVAEEAEDQATKLAEDALKGTEAEKAIGDLLGGGKSDSLSSDSTKNSDAINTGVKQLKNLFKKKKKKDNK